MTVTQRKPQPQPEEVQLVNEPGVQYQCDACTCDLTHTIRIKCADPVCCETEEGVDLCPACFCAGREFANHKRGHDYRVIEFNSYPIFTEDWGADEELLLLRGIVSQGLGNWRKIAEHVGTRTKEEVEKHYNQVYVDSVDWPLPRMDLTFDIDPSEFQERKRRRITEMNNAPPPPHKPAPVSLPGIHEIAGYLPGRLEFEHELDNEAEELVKDLEFGVVLQYGGDDIPEDENDLDVRARIKWEEEKKKSASATKGVFSGKGIMPYSNMLNGRLNGYHHNGDVKSETHSDNGSVNGTTANGTAEAEDGPDEPMQPPPIETKDSLAFKLTTMEMYAQRVERRAEGKSMIFDRGLLEYRKMQAADKKRPREEREILHRLRPFSKLQTAADYEVFASDMLYESLLRKRIQELQQYRRLGLQTAADVDKYDADLAKRVQAKAAHRDIERVQHRSGSRQSSGPDPSRKGDDREATPRLPGSASALPIKRPGPLNLANSPSLHLLTPGEQTLCSQLRILPKAYLVVKETLVREYARRGGKLRRREARDLVKIDVNKTSRVWDFLVQAGFLKITNEPATVTAATTPAPQDARSPSVNGSPVKIQPPSPRVPPSPNVSLTNGSSGPFLAPPLINGRPPG